MEGWRENCTFYFAGCFFAHFVECKYTYMRDVGGELYAVKGNIFPRSLRVWRDTGRIFKILESIRYR